LAFERASLSISPVGNMPPIETLEWDTAFFGVQIGRISLGSGTREQLSEAVDWADRNEFDCLYWLIDAGDANSPRAAEDCGFHLVDIQITFETALCRGRISNEPLLSCVRLFEPGDLPGLLALGRESHRASRFFFDGSFGDDQCAAMYEEWIKRGLRRESNIVLVAEHENQFAGYCVCQVSGDRVGNIELIAVSPEFHRCHIGTALISAALHHFEHSGMQFATVVTQGRNIASQRLYQKCGFVTKAMKLWYHRWA
jgi:dTDP-4-amino-4,6-dideoxy-D-galactose acyltransferase